MDNKIGPAVAIAIGIALVYIALAGNASKLVSLFQPQSAPAAPAATAVQPNSISGTLAGTPGGTYVTQPISATNPFTLPTNAAGGTSYDSQLSDEIAQSGGALASVLGSAGAGAGTSGSLYMPTAAPQSAFMSTAPATAASDWNAVLPYVLQAVNN